MPKVFLGGTCNGSEWRNALIPLLKIDYFNPVVEEWTEADAIEEIRQREECDFCLYVITPKMTGIYSIAEVVEDAILRPQKTIFVYLQSDGDQYFTAAQLKSFRATEMLVKSHGATVLTSLELTADYLNQR